MTTPVALVTLALALALLLAHGGISQSVVGLMSPARLLLTATPVILLGLTPAAERLLRPRLRSVFLAFSLRRPRIPLTCLGNLATSRG